MALADNLVSYWKFDGNSNDSVGSNNGTDTSVSYTTGKINQGASFNGSSSKVTVTSNAGLQITGNLTISAWVKITDSGNKGGCVVAKSSGGTTNYEYEFAVTTTNLVMVSAGTSDYFYNQVTTSAVTAGVWHHVAVVRVAGTSITYYIDGIPYSGTTSHGSITYVATSTQDVRIGGSRGDNYSGLYFNGSIDEVGIWSRALSADEVLQLYNSNRALAYPLTAPSLYGGVAYWKLDESSGNATDSIGSNTLTNNNTTTYGAAKINNGAIFNGSNQSLSSATITPFTNAYTVNYWINPDDSDTSNQTSFSIRPATGNVNVIQIEGLSTSKLRCIMYSSNGTSNKEYRTSVALTAGTWNMITLTWDGSTWTIYTNGTADSSITKTFDDSVTLTNTSRTLRLGAETGSSNFFDGNEDEVGIWSRALSSSEVTALYNSGSGKQYPFPATNIKSLNGLAYASVKSKNGLAMASIKSVNGLA